MQIYPRLQNGLSLVCCLILGRCLNMGIFMVSSTIIQPTPNADLTTLEELFKAMPLMEPKHFLLPFLAQPIGTLTGAFIVSLFPITHKLIFDFIIGFLFFLGGITNILMLPSPLWFTFWDLTFAYIPSAYFDYHLTTRIQKKIKQSKN